MSGKEDTKAIIIQPEGRGKTPLQEWPVHMECPHCGGYILTSLEYETGTLTWIMCFFIMFIGLFLGCCIVPFCMDGCKDIAHICPDCKREVGRFYRIWHQCIGIFAKSVLFELHCIVLIVNFMYHAICMYMFLLHNIWFNDVQIDIIVINNVNVVIIFQ